MPTKLTRVLLTVGTTILLAACAAPPTGSVDIDESVAGARPTLEATPDPTPRASPVSLNFESLCSDWKRAVASEQLSWAQSLLRSLPGANDDAPPSELVAAIEQKCDEGLADNLMAVSEVAVGSDPRFLRTPAPTPAPTPVPTPISYKQLTAREWDLLVKTPDDYTGNGYIVWGCITQFDAATGEAAFLATSAEGPREYWSTDSDQAYFVGEPDLLRPFVEDDVISMTVISQGSYSFDTQDGGNTTVPQFDVTGVTLQGSCG